MPSDARLDRNPAIARLLPADVVVVACDPGHDRVSAFAIENRVVAHCVERRRREFVAGRVCARAALMRLGMDPRPLLVAEDRTPLWPPGVCGSISHCDDYCVAAVGMRRDYASLGIDVEHAAPLDRSLVQMVCTAREIAMLDRLSGPSPEVWAKVVFSIKESLYKCDYMLFRQRYDFHDVEVSLDPARGAYTGLIAPSAGRERRVQGLFHIAGRHVFAAIHLRQDPRPGQP